MPTLVPSLMEPAAVALLSIRERERRERREREREEREREREEKWNKKCGGKEGEALGVSPSKS